MSSVNRDSLTSSFPIYMSIIYFSYLIALIETSKYHTEIAGVKAYILGLFLVLGRKLSASPY